MCVCLCVCFCVCVCVDVRKCIIGKCARWVHITPLQQSHAHTRQSPCNYPGKYIWRCPRRSAMWSAACTGRARTLSSGPWWRRRHAQPLSLLATTVTLAGHLRDVCGRTGQAQDSTGSSQQAHVREGSRTTSSPESISGKSFFFSLSKLLLPNGFLLRFGFRLCSCCFFSAAGLFFSFNFARFFE